MDSVESIRAAALLAASIERYPGPFTLEERTIRNQHYILTGRFWPENSQEDENENGS